MFLLLLGLLCATSRRLRPVLWRVGVVVLIGAGLLAVVGWGRWFGGTPGVKVLQESVQTLLMASSIALGLGVVGSICGPLETLQMCDDLRIPRTVAYVLVSVQTTLRLVREYGRRLLVLLRLKGMVGGGLLNRGRSYYRLLAPLFTVLMNSQLVHARSLECRGYFDEDEPRRRVRLRWRLADALWLGLASVLIGGLRFGKRL